MNPARGRAGALLALALLVSCAAPLQRPVGPVALRERAFDVLHYDFDLTLDLPAGHVLGEAGLDLVAGPAPLTEVVLDAVDLAVERVTDGQGRSLVHESRPETLVIRLADPLPPGERARITIRYDAYPRRGLVFLGPEGHDPSRPWQAWSQGQAQDNRHWLPLVEQLDERATHTLAVTVDERFTTVAAGTLVESVSHRSRGRRTDVWSMDTPHVAYLITLVVGELEQGELLGPLPLPVVARARDLPRALHATRHTAEMLELFGHVTGRPYPYPRYAQTFIDDFTAGGMENICATTMYDEGLTDPDDLPQRDLSGLVAHELAHQWFGDLLTCADWAHTWINEGWADYAELLWTRHHHGADAEEAQRLDYQRGGCQAELAHSRPVVWHDYSHPDELFDNHSYNGGAARIHQLERLLGRRTFGACVRAWVAWAAERSVTTDDLQRVFEQTSGRDLERFFQQWFHGVGFPILEGRVQGDRLVLEQTQGRRHGWRDDFLLAFDVAWSRGGREASAPLVMDGPVEQLVLTGEGPLDWVRVDAGSDLPAQVLTRQDQAAWVAQLTGADRAATRLVAARWLAGDRWVVGDDEAELEPLSEAAVQALLDRLAVEPDVRVRVAMVAALAAVDGTAVDAALLRACEAPDLELAVAALDAMGPRLARAQHGLEVVTASLDHPNEAVASAAARALVASGSATAGDRLRSLLEQRHEVRLQRDVVDLLARLAEPSLLPLLLTTARRHPERWVRAAAVTGLATRGGAHGEEVFRQLCRSLGDDSYQVRAAAARALGLRGDERAVSHLRAAWDLEADLTVLDALEASLAVLD